MGIVKALSADAMLSVENQMVVNASLSTDNLILTKKDGSTSNVGSVRGPSGDMGGVVPRLYSAQSQDGGNTYLSSSWMHVNRWAFNEGDGSLLKHIKRFVVDFGWQEFFEVQESGLYLLNFTSAWPFSTTSGSADVGRRFVGVYRDGALLMQSSATTVDSRATVEVNFPYYLAAGKELGFKVFNDGSTSIIWGGAAPNHEFNVLKIG